MKSHKYWSIGALVSMIGTCYTGYKRYEIRHINTCAFKFTDLHGYGHLLLVIK